MEMLERIEIERMPDGRFRLLRRRRTTGETFISRDLIDAFATVRAAYFADGSPRPVQVRSTEKDSAK